MLARRQPGTRRAEGQLWRCCCQEASQASASQASTSQASTSQASDSQESASLALSQAFTKEPVIKKPKPAGSRMLEMKVFFDDMTKIQQEKEKKNELHGNSKERSTTKKGKNTKRVFVKRKRSNTQKK